EWGGLATPRQLSLHLLQPARRWHQAILPHQQAGLTPPRKHGDQVDQAQGTEIERSTESMAGGVEGQEAKPGRQGHALSISGSALCPNRKNALDSASGLLPPDS